MQKNIEISDQKLVKQYMQGNDACLRMLIEKYQEKIFGTILFIVKDRYMAEDIFQETFIKVIKTIKKGKYNEQGKFAPWVVQIARNLAIDHFRKSKKKPVIVGESGDDIFKILNLNEDNHETTLIKSEQNSTVRKLIHLLPPEQREVLVLRHFGDLSFKEISKVTGVSINTALGRMRYALKNIRKMIEEKQLNLQ